MANKIRAKAEKQKKQIKDPILKTKRLVIRPLTDEELAIEIEGVTDDGLKAAFNEMLEGSKEHPETRLFYTNWVITLKGTDIKVGSLCFKGRETEYETEIGYGIDDEYCGKGYATEAVKMMIGWAFQRDADLYFITAEAEDDNLASKRVLEKCELVAVGKGLEGQKYECERPLNSWISIYLCLGMSIGMCFGMSVFDNLSIGMCFGMAIGAAIGASLDAAERKKHKEIREKTNREIT